MLLDTMQWVFNCHEHPDLPILLPLLPKVNNAAICPQIVKENQTRLPSSTATWSSCNAHTPIVRQWSARPWLAQTCSYYIFAFGHRPLQCDNAGHSSNQCLGRSQERRQYAIVLSVCSSPQRCHTRGLCHINFNGGGHQMNQLSGLVRLCEWISVDQRIKTKQVVRFIDEHIIISFSALNYNSQ